MKPDQFRSVLKKRPFQTFVLIMASGESYQITHPESVWQAPEGGDTVIFQHQGEVIMIGVDLISEVRFLTNVKS